MNRREFLILTNCQKMVKYNETFFIFRDNLWF